LSTRDIVLVALCAALICALGLIPAVPVSLLPVPITLQTMGVMLAGLYFGPVRGALACLLVVGLVVLGLPVLSGGRGGVAVLAGPTAGFLLGWVPGAFVTGWLAGGQNARSRSRAATFLVCLAAACVGGIAIVYAGGIAWLALVTGLPFGRAALGTLVFLPGDILKAVFAAVVTAELRRVYPVDAR
jgi:biotin transport system substrate-specific component